MKVISETIEYERSYTLQQDDDELEVYMSMSNNELSMYLTNQDASISLALNEDTLLFLRDQINKIMEFKN